MGLFGKDLDDLRDAWHAQWQGALAAWSRHTLLSEPLWCLTKEDEKEAGLNESFAMIRLTGHRVVVSLRQVRKLGLEHLGREILAHEVGHHTLAPADLTDHARLLARTRINLPTRESRAPYVANLYTDLIINDRLQRSAGLDMAQVYRLLRAEGGSPDLWTLYMRIYEVLWSLPSGTLADMDRVQPKAAARIQGDAALGARLARAYSRHWLDGAGRFAALLLPYLLELPDQQPPAVAPWYDTLDAGAGDALPDGLAGLDPDELEQAPHPALDPELSGLGDMEGEATGKPEPKGSGSGGRAYRPRGPRDFTGLMRSMGVTLPESEMVARYYRELARAHLIRYPVREIRQGGDPLPEGLEEWDAGSPLAEVDWMESLMRSPQPIPGVSLLRRTYGTTQGGEPDRQAPDLYLGIDCSGSMSNPAFSLAYPILAGAVVALSALRAKARVWACLSGEPGKYAQTQGFTRNEMEILTTLTSYLGTGYAFGILRLKEPFLDRKPEPSRKPAHILVLTDRDIFQMLAQAEDGWEVAGKALKAAGAGGSMILHVHPASCKPGIEQLEQQGWNVHCVTDQKSLLTFARDFSKALYEKTA